MREWNASACMKRGFVVSLGFYWNIKGNELKTRCFFFLCSCSQVYETSLNIVRNFFSAVK